MRGDLTSTRRQVNGVTLHAVEAGPGDGPLVILLHGFPDHWWSWHRQIEPLADQGCRVVAPDMRGYNLSSKPASVADYALDTLVADVMALADAHERSRFRLVGHDWGGVVAWWCAVRHPDRVERLAVLGAPHPDTWTRQALLHPSQALRSSYVALFQVPFLPEAVLRAGGFALLRRALTANSRPRTFTAQALDRYEEAWSQPGALTGMLSYYRALRLRPAEGAPHRIAPPALVIWGRRDAFLEPHLFRAALDLCDRGEGVLLDAAGHWVQLEEAEAVNAALARFFGAG